ncbi:hypothetical protein A2690_02070 [Candidatus Roizmanbacteria bacterium RIFCSPHIGHO2_01_FULL_39_12b]|uniref:Uncharacterized protein n=1 Tax=Candidatus Roizmanbacteria bacterium RIFCSPHIGHO2_01_FULL_39_12b TaxID=1802030 RepID=A0A1F7GE26_9BACT|nr:MAG: hypothetical protein A2690_02070 [Candidatus Roizmanbacteria bacterium RIFCSPHIGHO2_01_FULL_39_12b]OGK46315.1 MAG: hypothetical protein A3B46_00040 [Candidatus Roizmanbacteria bacterium RIFCSPLOWO2_01_FULL_39_19]
MAIDGKWLHRSDVIMIYRNITSKINLYWSWHRSESYEAITTDFVNLIPIIKNNAPSGIATAKQNVGFLYCHAELVSASQQ